MSTLLSRDEFRKSVLERDNYKCVICGESNNPVAHHILERRLFNDGGYYLDNGATVCNNCHFLAESTTISVETLREKIKANENILPEHFYSDLVYDKWGNIILPNGTRLKGELFFDESVQKIIKIYLNMFVKYVKYPRTYHTPWSLGMHDDDRMIDSMDNFIGKDVVVSIKMDGENTTMYNDNIHARSIDSNNHESRNWVKNFWNTISYEIPDNWRICGENLFAKHSTVYNDLPSYFLGFSIWNEKNICLSWDDTITYFDLLNIKSVPVLYKGIYDEDLIKSLWDKSKYDTTEGYVIRLSDSFSYGDFRKSVAKFVRPNHVQTAKHWFEGQRMECNKLKLS